MGPPQTGLRAYHTHRCASCGHVWGHYAQFRGIAANRAEHTCARCGALQYYVEGFPLAGWAIVAALLIGAVAIS
jgi:ribosomal protein S14